jgi:hypothetical protein
MKIGLKDQIMELKDVMTEDEMELYLLQNGYDLGEGVCEKGKEHLYIPDSTRVVDFAMELGYKVKMNSEGVNIFFRTDCSKEKVVEMLRENITPIQKRVLEAMKHWDVQRLRSELELYILTDSDESLESQFFEDIATKEEREIGTLLPNS